MLDISVQIQYLASLLSSRHFFLQGLLNTIKLHQAQTFTCSKKSSFFPVLLVTSCILMFHYYAEAENCGFLSSTNTQLLVTFKVKDSRNSFHLSCEAPECLSCSSFSWYWISPRMLHDVAYVRVIPNTFH